jgi:benzoyl-CoA reductase/2-hydroxyglutaryl-CoA dehydratase subunit BcrC/BadD/HgdB
VFLIFWVHLIPYYQESLKHYFNSSEKYQLIASDMVLDFTDTLNPEDPFRSLARKLIKNVFNGSYSHKAETIGKLADMMQPDAVINFCHWGCKQASGGSILLKEAMKERNIPMLILDGDGIDHRNSHDGQIKTRLEAFLEMIEEDKE